MPFLLNNYFQNIAMGRARPMVELVLPWLQKREGKILDFGCGLGHIGYLISQLTGRQMVFLDVRKYPFVCPSVEIKTFNGKEIPFTDKFFDTSLIFLVLHHVHQPPESIKEVIRVTSHEIIVIEDLLQTKNEMIGEAMKDTIANCFLPHMTMQYRIESDWEAMFTRLGLRIIGKICFNSRYIFNFRHVTWQLFLE